MEVDKPPFFGLLVLEIVMFSFAYMGALLWFNGWPTRDFHEMFLLIGGLTAVSAAIITR